jgi:hypothetical protein
VNQEKRFSGVIGLRKKGRRIAVSLDRESAELLDHAMEFVPWGKSGKDLHTHTEDERLRYFVRHAVLQVVRAVLSEARTYHHGWEVIFRPRTEDEHWQILNRTEFVRSRNRGAVMRFWLPYSHERAN